MCQMLLLPIKSKGVQRPLRYACKEMLLPTKSGGTQRSLRPGRCACKEMLASTTPGGPTIRQVLFQMYSQLHSSCMICIATPQATLEYCTNVDRGIKPKGIWTLKHLYLISQWFIQRRQISTETDIFGVSPMHDMFGAIS